MTACPKKVTLLNVNQWMGFKMSDLEKTPAGTASYGPETLLLSWGGRWCAVLDIMSRDSQRRQGL
jgi:hypothetical protein